MQEQMKLFSGTAVKMQLISNGLCYGPCPMVNDEVEQRITITPTHIWVSRYQYGDGLNYGLLQKFNGRIARENGEAILAVVAAYFSDENHIVPFATDVGSWELVLTNEEGEKYRFFGSLISLDAALDNICDNIRERLDMPFLYLFNGDDRQDRMAGLTGIDYRCVITYKDASTGLSITHPLTISFSRVVNGGGIVDLLVTTPSGNVFKNTEVATLTAKAELWRGSSVDTTNVTYKWAIMDSTVTSTSSTGYDASFGVGWKKLSDTAGMYTGTTTATITIYAAAVDSYAVFKCIAVDSDSASNTYNSKFTDVATFIDNSDPIQVVITSTGGDVFKNGQGSTTLTAVVYQAGSEIDADGKGTYTWTKYNKDGAIDTSWGTSGTKTGKTLAVSTSDVTTKATFMVVVTI